MGRSIKAPTQGSISLSDHQLRTMPATATKTTTATKITPSMAPKPLSLFPTWRRAEPTRGGAGRPALECTLPCIRALPPCGLYACLYLGDFPYLGGLDGIIRPLSAPGVSGATKVVTHLQTRHFQVSPILAVAGQCLFLPHPLQVLV